MTAGHDHYLTLLDSFPEQLADLLIDGVSHNITPRNNSNVNPMKVAIQAGRQDEFDHDRKRKNLQNTTTIKTQILKDFTTWTVSGVAVDRVEMDGPGLRLVLYLCIMRAYLFFPRRGLSNIGS